MNAINKDISKLAYSEGWLSIIANIILFGIKYWAGIVSGSVALITDAWHSLTDSASSVAVIIGTKVSTKPADKHHPFGHGRAELITSLIIGFLLVIVGINFIFDSIESIKNNETANFGTVAIIVMIVSIVIKEASAQYAFYTARKTGLVSLKADAWHHRTDALSSVIILIGIFLSPYIPYLDGIMGIIVSLFILHTAYSIIRESASAVLGESPNEGLLKEICQTANKSAGFELYAHHFLVHKYGIHTELSFHICLPKEMTVIKAHEIAEKVESDIYKTLKVSATTHIDPDIPEIRNSIDTYICKSK